MVTTGNETDKPKTAAKPDNKAMKDAYIAGARIDAIADKYGLTSNEVTDIVVTPEPVGPSLKTQEQHDAGSKK